MNTTDDLSKIVKTEQLDKMLRYCVEALNAAMEGRDYVLMGIQAYRIHELTEAAHRLSDALWLAQQAPKK